MRGEEAAKTASIASTRIMPTSWAGSFAMASIATAPVWSPAKNSADTPTMKG